MNGISNYSVFTNAGSTGMDSFVKGLNKADNAKSIKNAGVKETAKKGSTSQIAAGIELSDAAKSMLEKLKEKYDNVDFFVADYETQEEAQKYLSQGTKDYSVLLDSETLEKMAADEEEESKYTDMIANALGQLDDMKEKLGEEGADVKSLGVSIDKDGTLTYFAELEKSGDRQREIIEKNRAEKKEKAKADEKAREKRTAKEALAEKAAENAEAFATTKKTTVKAGSVEELLDKIRNVDWSQVQAQERPAAGSFINFGV